MTAGDEPAFGLGRDDRPLGDAMEWQGEQLRRVLRVAGYAEFVSGEVENGFVVEASDDGSAPHAVDTTVGDHAERARLLAGYEAVLTSAGYEVAYEDPGDPDAGLDVAPQPVD